MLADILLRMLLEPVLPVNAMLVSVFTLAVVNHGKAVLTIFFIQCLGYGGGLPLSLLEPVCVVICN